MTRAAGDSEHSTLCLRLMQLFPRIARGMRRCQSEASPPSPSPLGPRHAAALEELRDQARTVGELAARLGLSLPAASGVIADLDRAGYVERRADPDDRRRSMVSIAAAKLPAVTAWLDGAASPVARMLDQLDADEQATFLKAMSLLEAELGAERERSAQSILRGSAPGRAATGQATSHRQSTRWRGVPN